MCGIAGFATEDSPLLVQQLELMQKALKHRDPDGKGKVLLSAAGKLCRDEEKHPVAGLADTRLSILDLTSAGAQPMANEDEDVWITFIGEFYNCSEFRTGLISCGHLFASSMSIGGS